MKSGLAWLGSAAAVTRVIDLGAMLTVLWFVTKEQLGLASVALSIGAILEAISASGIGVSAAVVQMPKLSERQMQSAFWFSVAVAAVIGSGLLLSAPWVADFYAAPSLTPMLGALALRQLTSGIIAIPISLLNRRLQFKEAAAAQTGASLIAAIARAGSAVLGAGAWALVIGQIVQSVVMMAMVLWLAKFWPALGFSRSALSPLWRFGSRIALANMVHQLFLNADYMIIGRLLGMGTLGLYRVAFEIAMEGIIPIAAILARTAVPVLSRLRETPERFRATFLWTTRSLGLMIVPILLVAFFAAEDLLHLIADGEFLDAAGSVRLLLVAGYLRVHFQIYVPLFTAWGHPGVVLRLEVMALAALLTSLGICLTWLGPSMGVAAAGVAWIAVYPPLLLAAYLLARERLQLPFGALLRSMFPSALTLACVSVPLWLLTWTTQGQMSHLLRLLSVVAATLLLYFLFVKLVFGIDPRRLSRSQEPTAAEGGS